ncbi:MAG: methionine/alanine import family NSS transporter small subunit [Rothia sp. (in: high G+C Gram-positive bacteria)]|nr:methionine/alanine import family NSS transporter small subunit [Rothia sp. (in: high G+C Gram-positive bacteria)]MDO5751135.1 methionine/alanine import family NSS transporter small subunit [Rothia sp. (in: high G+C Gram-positive bacteria)]
MSLEAIIMCAIAILIIWGGLGLALWNLSRHPELEDDDNES